jgi:hypothetical protein
MCVPAQRQAPGLATPLDLGEAPEQTRHVADGAGDGRGIRGRTGRVVDVDAPRRGPPDPAAVKGLMQG